MHSAIRELVSQTLGSLLYKPQLNRTLDLGCGSGDGGEILRPYTRYLVAVDLDPAKVEAARRRKVYSEVHLGDLRAWRLDGYDSVAIFDALEHIPKEEGEELLDRLGNRVVILTTPWWSFEPLEGSGHLCLWSPQELQDRGFKTWTRCFLPDFFMFLAYGGITLGVRGL